MCVYVQGGDEARLAALHRDLGVKLVGRGRGESSTVDAALASLLRTVLQKHKLGHLMEQLGPEIQGRAGSEQEDGVSGAVKGELAEAKGGVGAVAATVAATVGAAAARGGVR